MKHTTITYDSKPEEMGGKAYVPYLCTIKQGNRTIDHYLINPHIIALDMDRKAKEYNEPLFFINGTEEKHIPTKTTIV